jgi:hypothetical protein
MDKQMDRVILNDVLLGCECAFILKIQLAASLLTLKGHVRATK